MARYYDDELDLDTMSGIDIVGAAAVAQQSGFTIDNLLAGFPKSASIAAGADDETEVKPSRAMRPQLLVIDPGFTVAECAMTQLKVGPTDQNIGDGPCPASMFSQDATYKLKGDTIDPSIGAKLTLTNNTAGAITDVTKALVGPAAVRR